MKKSPESFNTTQIQLTPGKNLLSKTDRGLHKQPLSICGSNCQDHLQGGKQENANKQTYSLIEPQHYCRISLLSERRGTNFQETYNCCMRYFIVPSCR